MLDLEQQKKNFKDHIATFTDYGNIKILDFKNPQSSEYRIRFLFEEDYCKLHISGDLGDLTASNYSNMTYGKFSDFVNNTGYFEGKIDCHSRPLYYYDEDTARKTLLQMIDENGLSEKIADEYDVDYYVDEVFTNYDDSNGIDRYGYDKLNEYFSDVWEFAGDLGKKETKILELYMLAFKLAQRSLKEQEREENG